MRNADRGENSQAVETGRLRVRAQFAHLAIEKVGRFQQAFAFFRWTGDQEFAIDQSQRNRLIGAGA